MKLNPSVTTKVTIVFIITLLLLVAALLPIDKMIKIKSHKEISEYYERLIGPIHKNRLHPNQIVKHLKSFNFKQIQNPQDILDKQNMTIIRKKGFAILLLDNRYYLHIRTPHFQILLKDELNKFEKNYYHFVVFAIVLSLLILIYILILKNIKDTNLQLSSRKLFLRTLMHELKTPIAKGRIVSELITDQKQKDRMIDIFENLNYLIDDFVKVEKILSKNHNLNMTSVSIDTIVNKSIDMLMLETHDKVTIEDTLQLKLDVDLELFTIAIKNLLDNGLKYSSDGKVMIKVKDHSLLFISKGDELPRALKEYFKPFHNETKNKNHGMGLGLYIVDSVVKIHNMKFKYIFDNQENIFIIDTNT